MKNGDLKLGNVQKMARQKTPVVNKPSERSLSIADLLNEEDKQAYAELKRTGRKPKPFTDADAFEAEILARFGFETFQAWNRDEIPTSRMISYLKAERARDAARQLALQSMILEGAMVGVAKKPKSHVKSMHKVLKATAKMAKGD